MSDIAADNDIYANELTMTMLRSDDFIIYTKEIRALEAKILEIVMLGNCGACVVSRPRCGKTTSMVYIARSLKQRYGEEFPVVMWDITDHPVTEKNFYSTLLTAMGVKHTVNHTALVLKNRVLSELVTLASDTPFNKVVLMIDEAWRLDEKDFTWLMDLYNILRRYNLQLITVFFSTNELLDKKRNFKSEGLDQIVERFFLNIYNFHGIRDKGELMICLNALDNAMMRSVASDDKPMRLKDFYFPRAKETDEFFKLGDLYWEAFNNVKTNYGIGVEDIPMEFVVGSFRILLGCYGKLSANSVVWPGYNEIHESILRSGYTESDDVHVKTFSKRRNKR
jgi:hypothetical protein